MPRSSAWIKPKKVKMDPASANHAAFSSWRSMMNTVTAPRMMPASVAPPPSVSRPLYKTPVAPQTSPNSAQPDPLEMLMRKDAVKTAVSRFVELPTLQRSVVILKDVLDELLIEIAALLDLTVDAVKGHLARGRAHLREINAHGRPLPDTRPASVAVARYVALFNQRDWDGLRALLADDVKLHQSLHPLRVGRADVGLFFTLYAKIDGVSLAPAWLEGREVIAVFEDRADPKPSYIMWLEWRNGRISFIRDYRYVRYVTADAELTLASEAKPADDGAAQ